MVKSSGWSIKEVMIGATGTGLSDSALSDVAAQRVQVADLFYDLSNEWLNEEVEADPLWHTYYEDEDFELLSERVIGYLTTNISSEHNIPVTLLFQCLQVCLDYLKTTNTQGYFLEIGSFFEGEDSGVPVWYRTSRDVFHPRPPWFIQSYIRHYLRRACDKILRGPRDCKPIYYLPDMRCGSAMEVLRQRARGQVPVQVGLEVLSGSDKEQILTDVAEHFLEYVCPYQEVLENFGSSRKKDWIVKTEKNRFNQQVVKLILRGSLPDFNPIFAGLTTRSILESCSVNGVTMPLKLAVELDLDK